MSNKNNSINIPEASAVSRHIHFCYSLRPRRKANSLCYRPIVQVHLEHLVQCMAPSHPNH